MGHLRSDLRDVESDLFEVLRIQDGPAGPGVDTDPTTLRALLHELHRHRALQHPGRAHLTDNIVHLVLARPEASPTRG